jgi:hypothetical protein
VASGHLALDSCGWHPFYQGTTLISLTSAAIRADTVAHGRGRADGLTATVNVDRADDAESGRHPPVTRSRDRRQPQGESGDHLGELRDRSQLKSELPRGRERLGCRGSGDQADQVPTSYRVSYSTGGLPPLGKAGSSTKQRHQRGGVGVDQVGPALTRPVLRSG